MSDAGANRTNPRGNGGKDKLFPSAITSESLAVIKRFADATGRLFDPTRAVQAQRQAEKDIEPTESRAAYRRVIQAAANLGVQVLIRQMSVREALRVVNSKTPLAIFAVKPDGTARWHVLVDRQGHKGKLLPLAPGDPEDWLDAGDIAQEIGAADADVVLEWLLAEPMAP